MIEKNVAISLSWEDISERVSKYLTNFFEKNVECKASSDDWDYWSVKIITERIPREEVIRLMNSIGSSKREREDTLPEWCEDEETINSFGCMLSEHLLLLSLNVECEDSFCTKETLWLVGIKENIE